jgi:hypothetical protein
MEMPLSFFLQLEDKYRKFLNSEHPNYESHMEGNVQTGHHSQEMLPKMKPDVITHTSGQMLPCIECLLDIKLSLVNGFSIKKAVQTFK